MDNRKISVEKRMDLNQVVEYLEDLVRCFKTGIINVEQAEQKLTLEVPQMVDVEVEAKVKKGKTKFSLELEWRDVAESDEETELSINNRAAEEASGHGEVSGHGEECEGDQNLAAKALQATAEAAAKATSPVSSGGRKTASQKKSSASTKKGSTSKKSSSPGGKGSAAGKKGSKKGTKSTA